MPLETPASIPAQPPEPLAPVDPLTPKPRKRRRRKHLPPILAEGKAGDATMLEVTPEETIAWVFLSSSLLQWIASLPWYQARSQIFFWQGCRMLDVPRGPFQSYDFMKTQLKQRGNDT